MPKIEVVKVLDRGMVGFGGYREEVSPLAADIIRVTFANGSVIEFSTDRDTAPINDRLDLDSRDIILFQRGPDGCVFITAKSEMD